MTVANIGGISEGTIDFAPGVTILAGANASNKSSLLQGVNAVIGGPDPSLKSDVDHGEVRLSVDGDEAYYVDVSRQNGRPVVSDAHRFSSARDWCELFVSLDESNPVRRAVVGDGDLHSLLMRPIDTDEIEAEIERLEHRKSSLDDRLADLERLEDALPSLESRERSLRSELNDVEERLAEQRRAIEDAESTQTTSEETQQLLDELRDARSERESLRDRLHTHEDVIESLHEERRTVRARIDEFEDEGATGELASIEHELDQLRREKNVLSNTITSLSPLVEMNRQLLVDDETLVASTDTGDVLERLDPNSRSMTCWTCGSTVDHSQIVEQVEVIGEIVSEKRDQRRSIEEQIEALGERKRRIERTEHELNGLTDRARELDSELETRERTTAELTAELERLTETVTDLESAVESTDELRDSTVVELHNEVSQLEYRRGQLESKLEATREEIESNEVALDEREALEAERSSVRERLREKRDRISTLERDTVATINECMQEMLELLAYENIERVWVERLGGDGLDDTTFELHVVRTTADGAAYEDVIDHLSKSEREVLGLVVALAGYIVYDVAEEVPVVVIDAIEMLDADRIQALLDFFSQHARYVLAATLPEEARQLGDAYRCVEVRDLVTS